MRARNAAWHSASSKQKAWHSNSGIAASYNSWRQYQAWRKRSSHQQKHGINRGKAKQRINKQKMKNEKAKKGSENGA